MWSKEELKFIDNHQDLIEGYPATRDDIIDIASVEIRGWDSTKFLNKLFLCISLLQNGVDSFWIKYGQIPFAGASAVLVSGDQQAFRNVPIVEKNMSEELFRGTILKELEDTFEVEFKPLAYICDNAKIDIRFERENYIRKISSGAIKR